jgi:NTP pyrophosphatase (non-canonical NTP hydrolase)
VTELSLADYQQAAVATAIPSAFNDDYLVPGLVAESGEVAGKYAKGVRDGFPHDYVEEIVKELGDVLWFIAVLADVYGITLDEVASKNVAKLQSRKARGVIGGSGDNR